MSNKDQTRQTADHQTQTRPATTPEQAARALVTPLKPPDPSLRKIRKPRKA